MKKKRTRRLVVGAVVPLAAVATFAATAAALVGPGPSTSVNPYITPVAGGIDITSVLTTADPTKTATNGYKMVGIPDGLGGRTLPSGDVEVYMNHELGTTTAGITRAHGQTGAFVSKYTINPATLEVKTGADLIQSLQYWNYDLSTPNGGAYQTTVGGSPVVNSPAVLPSPALARLCSASLATPAQLYNAATGKGFNSHLFFTGEESAPLSLREFAVDVTTGIAYELPKTGLFPWENMLAATTNTDTTLTMGQEDGTSYLWAYQGTKTNAGSPVDKAGLTNGRNYVAKVTNPTGGAAVGTDVNFRSTVGKGVPAPVTFTDVNWNQTASNQQTEAAAEGGMTFQRIEDGAFDPSNPSDFYFVTTNSFAGLTGLWKLHWNNMGVAIGLDPTDPNGLLQNAGPTQSGATLTLVLDGTEIPSNDVANGVPKMFDNIDIDGEGHIILLEDPGNNAYVSRVHAYRISDGKLATIARFTGGPYNGGSTVDEETSGVITTSALFGPRTFMLDAQIHTAQGLPAGTGAGTVQEFVEQGQLLLMKVNDWATVFDGPGSNVPEAPLVALMSVSAIAVLGGGVLFIKRRKGFVLA